MFWEFHDLLFERQADWSALDTAGARDFYIGLATELGLDIEQFTADIDNGTFAEYVLAAEEEAQSLGLPGTPAAIVNGNVIPGEGLPREFEVWDQFIRDEIAVRAAMQMQYDAPPPMTIDADKQYLATVTMESGEQFVIELLPKSAPQTVNSFVFLANEGYFNGVTFHRVIPGFVAQTGDPSGTGRGGPGYMITNEIDPELSHSETGIVAMANAGPDTNGSQWYVTLGDVSQLDGGYTIFGRILEGMDVVQGITPRDPQQDPNAPPGDTIATITIAESGG
jgi:cyclophilin family peptidyl-prolyl cis-trans isomerase